MAAEYNTKRNRPKKKSNRFMRNAKGFAKKGIYGRGTHIDDEQYSYFINILDAMKGGFEDAEQRVNMANNVFEQTKDQEIHLASNQIVCKALESLVGYVEDTQLQRCCEKFAENYRPICSDRFASHVLQKMIEIAFLRGLGREALIKTPEAEDAASDTKRAKPDIAVNEEQYNLETTFSDEHRKFCREFVLRTSKFLLNNLEDFVWDSCANHIMRTCILCLAGVHVPKLAFDKGGAELAKHRKLYKVPEAWTEVMKEFPQRLEMWPQFVEFPYQEHSSALLGVICIALRAQDKNLLKHFGKKILMDAFLKVDSGDQFKDDKKIEISDDENETENGKAPSEHNEATTNSEKATTEIVLPKVFEHQSSVILLETLITAAGGKLLTQLYAMLFTGRIYYLAQQQQTNFAVQKLLQHIKEKDDFETIFSELHPHIEEILKIGHTGVVAALATACLRLSAKQAQMITALQSALHMAGDKEKAKQLFCCFVKLKPHDIAIADKSAYVHLHGSLIVQQMLQYNKPIFLVNCILETPAEQLSAIFNTPNGSHIIDAFMQSKFIGEKSRERLIRQLEGFYVDLAITRHGSRVLEQCMAVAQEAQKARIVKELADKSNMLKGSPFGRIVYSKLRVDTYKLSATQWKSSLGQKPNKATTLFKDIIS